LLFDLPTAVRAIDREFLNVCALFALNLLANICLPG